MGLTRYPASAEYCQPADEFEAVGKLDEAFGVVFFEANDYCRRVEQAGGRTAGAEHVFVHRHLPASFEPMPCDEKQGLFERPMQTHETLWGTWTPHAYRRSGDST